MRMLLEWMNPIPKQAANRQLTELFSVGPFGLPEPLPKRPAGSIIQWSTQDFPPRPQGCALSVEEQTWRNKMLNPLVLDICGVASYHECQAFGSLTCNVWLSQWCVKITLSLWYFLLPLFWFCFNSFMYICEAIGRLAYKRKRSNMSLPKHSPRRAKQPVFPLFAHPTLYPQVTPPLPSTP